MHLLTIILCSKPAICVESECVLVSFDDKYRVAGYVLVPNTAQGVFDCAAECKNHSYFALECPKKDTVRCQCAEYVTTSMALASGKCESGQGQCTGPYTSGAYRMGGIEAAAIYIVPRSPPPPPGKMMVTVRVLGLELGFGLGSVLMLH